MRQIGSVWSDTARMPSFGRLRGEVKTDVLVVGGGMAGLLCAYQLKRAGVACVVAEADRLCGGVTKNTTAKITAQHGLLYHKLLDRFGPERAALYLRANLKALAEFRRLGAQIDCDYQERDAFTYTLNDPGKVERELKALEKLGFQADYAGQLPLPFAVAGAVRFPRQAQFHPLKLAAALARDLDAYEQTRVLKIEGGRALTDEGRVTADKIIVATHFPCFNLHGSYFLKLYQHRSYVLALENAPDLGGMYLDDDPEGLSFRNYGGLLFLGGGSHRTGREGGDWEELEGLARRYYPRAKERYRWAAQDCMSLDEVPYIGPYSKRTPKVYVATGFNKWGMTGSMAAARLLTDRVLGKKNPAEMVFSPSRSMLHPQLARNGLSAVKHLLTPTAPRCPHMGCALKWNGEEHTWDCPCHGSRFTETGKLVDGPAAGDLRRSEGKGRADL